MPRRTVEKELADLAVLARRKDDPDAQPKLAAALGSKVNFVVARAAEIVGDFKLTALVPDLIEAFDRFLSDVSADKGCAAKVAIAKALYELGEPTAQPVFLAGIQHFEMSGGYGGAIDVAAELRGFCGLGLVRIGYRHVMARLVDLLADPAPQARAFAARALAYSERDEAALLLRMRLLVGDREIDVMNECFSALARFRQPDLAEFLARFFDNDEPDIRIGAALALGETRQDDALEALKDQHPQEGDPDVRRAIVLAIATLRLPAAIDWIMNLIESSRFEDAVNGIEALGMYKRDQAMVDRARAAAKSRKEPQIQRALEAHLSSQ